MAPSSRLCLICGLVADSDESRREHIEREHPGARVAWRNKRPWVIRADGREERIGASALKRMRRAAATAGGSATRTPRPVAPAPAPMVERPLPDAEPGTPPYFVQAIPPHFAASGAPVGPSVISEGDTSGPPVAPSFGVPADGPTGAPEPVAPGPSRESVRLALTADMIADLVRNLSITLSEWDGAGEAGHLSRIEAGQIGILLHEPAIDAVLRYFGGNVNRFRLAMVVGIIALGKGRVHYLAIRRKRAAQLAAAETVATAEAVAASAPEPVADGDPFAALAARQHVGIVA